MAFWLTTNWQCNAALIIWGLLCQVLHKCLWIKRRHCNRLFPSHIIYAIPGLQSGHYAVKNPNVHCTQTGGWVALAIGRSPAHSQSGLVLTLPGAFGSRQTIMYSKWIWGWLKLAWRTFTFATYRHFAEMRGISRILSLDDFLFLKGPPPTRR